MNAYFHILFYPESHYTKTRQIGFWRDGLLLLYDLLYTRWRLYWTFWMYYFKWSRMLYNLKNFVNAKLLYWTRRAIRRTLRLNYATRYSPSWDFKMLYTYNLLTYSWQFIVTIFVKFFYDCDFLNIGFTLLHVLAKCIAHIY